MIRQFLFFSILGALLATFLFQTSYLVHDLSKRKTTLHKEIATEQETIKILQAEWMHLNNPERLQKLAAKYLKLQSTTNAQIKSLNDVPGRVTHANKIMRPSGAVRRGY